MIYRADDQMSRLGIQVEVDIAVLRQNLFFRKSQFLFEDLLPDWMRILSFT